MITWQTLIIFLVVIIVADVNFEKQSYCRNDHFVFDGIEFSTHPFSQNWSLEGDYVFIIVGAGVDCV